MFESAPSASTTASTAAPGGKPAREVCHLPAELVFIVARVYEQLGDDRLAAAGYERAFDASRLEHRFGAPRTHSADKGFQFEAHAEAARTAADEQPDLQPRGGALRGAKCVHRVERQERVDHSCGHGVPGQG